MTKRILSLVMALAMVLSMVPAFAEEPCTHANTEVRKFDGYHAVVCLDCDDVTEATCVYTPYVNGKGTCAVCGNTDECNNCYGKDVNVIGNTTKTPAAEGHSVYCGTCGSTYAAAHVFTGAYAVDTDGEYKQSCACGVKGPACEHKVETVGYIDTDTNIWNGHNHTYTCQACNRVRTVTEAEGNPFHYLPCDATGNVVSGESEYHTHACPVCGLKSGVATAQRHEDYLENGVSAVTYEFNKEEGKHYAYCSICNGGTIGGNIKTLIATEECEPATRPEVSTVTTEEGCGTYCSESLGFGNGIPGHNLIWDHEAAEGQEATCVTKATCKYCGEQFGTVAAKHDWKDTLRYDKNNHWSECSDCPATSAPVAHNYVYTETVDAEGKTAVVYQCVCGASAACEGAGKDHNWVTVPASNGNCVPGNVEFGHSDYVQCSVCKAYKKGFERVDYTEIKHTIASYELIEEADCLKPGSKKGYCTVCKQWITATIPVEEGHTYDILIKTVYTNCAATAASLKAQVGAAKDNYEQWECSLCGAQTYIGIPGTGHSYTRDLAAEMKNGVLEYDTDDKLMNCVSGLYTVKACSAVHVDANGKETYCPEVQKNAKGEVIKTEVKNHDGSKIDTHNYYVVDVIDTKTCTINTTGKIYGCSNEFCELTWFKADGSDVYQQITDSFFANKGQHEIFTDATKKVVDMKKVRVEPVKAATCTTDGSELWFCVACDTQIGTDGKASTKPVTVKAFGHTNDAKKFPGKSLHSNNHAAEDVVETYTEKKTGETYEVVWTYVARTCTEYGYFYSNCSECNDNLREIRSSTCNVCKPNSDLTGGTHKWENGPVIQAPTCDKDGKRLMVCAYCGKYQQTVKKDPVTGRDMVDANGNKIYEDLVVPVPATCSWTPESKLDKEPTCKTYGEGWVVCSVCGDRQYADQKNKLIDKIKHSYAQMFVEVCEKYPTYGWYCVYCGELKENTIPTEYTELGKVKHDLTATDFVKLCNEEDYGLIQVCTKCDKAFFTDLFGKTYKHPTSVSKTFDLVKEETCTEDGLKITYACPDCDYYDWKNSESVVIPAAHKGTKTGTEAATCVDYGYDVFKCTVCNEVYKEKDYSKKPIGKENATRAQHANIVVLDWIEKGSCTKVGFGYAECAACGWKSVDPEYITAGHTEDLKNIVVVVAPTCGANGKGYVVCKDCGLQMRTLTDAENAKYLPATQKHTFAEKKVVSKNCLDASYVQWQCTICKAADPTAKYVAPIQQTVNGVKQTKDGNPVMITNLISVSAVGTAHDLADKPVYVAPTCTTEGGMAQKCAHCEYFKVVANKEDALGHDPVPTKVESTCYKAGVEYKTCFVCGLVYDKVDVALAPHKLVKDEDASIKATCSTSGVDVFVCSECGYISDAYVPADGETHKYVTINELRPMNCKTGVPGVAVQKCAYCDLKEFVNYITVKHDYADAGVITAPTCAKAGVMKIVCNVCGAESTRQIKALKHTLVDVVLAADCEQDAGISTQCSECGHETKFVKTGAKALGHKFGAKYAVAATCTEPAMEIQDCIRCDKQLKKTVGVANGHKGVKVDHVDGTCVTKDHDVYLCSVCGKEYDWNVKNYDYTNHDWTITKEWTEVTCSKAGMVDRKCELCGDTESYVPAKEDHTWSKYILTNNAYFRVCTVCGEVQSKWVGDQFINYTGCTAVVNGEIVGAHKGLVVEASKDATCTEAGHEGSMSCTACGAVLIAGGEIPAHKTEIIPEVPATCDADGKTAAVYCTVCKKVISGGETIPALGHTIVTVPAVDATAYAPGKTEGKQCSVCGYWEVEQQVIAQKTAKVLRLCVVREKAADFREDPTSSVREMLEADTVVAIAGALVNEYYPIVGGGYIHMNYISVA